MSLVRSAICQLVYRKIAIFDAKKLAGLLNVSKSAVYFNGTKGKPNKYTVELKKALKEAGQ